MIGRWLSSATNSVVSAAVIVASLSVLSRFVGFIRDRVLSGLFGAGDQLDIYYSAFKIPDLILQLLVIGALSAAFIPTFTKYFGKDNQKAWNYTNNLLNILTIVFLILAVAGIVLAPIYVPLLVPGFTPDKQAAVIESSRIIFLGQIFFVVSLVFGSVLQGAKRFALYSLAPIVNNVGILLGAWFLVPLIGPTGLAWGAVLGALFHALIQSLGVYALGYRYKPLFNFADGEVKTTLTQMVPRVMGLAVGQVNLIVMTSLASLLAVGSVTVLQFAFNLNFFPIGVIGVSYAIAAFPTFCDFANSKELGKLREALSSTVRQVMFFIVPATFITLLLRAQIVRLVYGAGVFDWDATILTADVLGILAISFFAQSLVYVLVRVYFALNDTWSPFFIALIAAALNIVLGVILTPTYGLLALGLAISLSAIAQLVLLWVILKQKLGSLDEKTIFKSVASLTFAALAAAAVTQAVKYAVVDYIPLDSFMNVLLQTLIAGGAGLIMYFATALILRSPEMLVFVYGLHGRLIRSAKPTETAQTLSN